MISMPLYDTVRALLRRVLALKAELAEPAVDATIELTEDPALGSFQASAVAPLGPADQQRLLAAPGPERAADPADGAPRRRRRPTSVLV